MIIYKTDRMPAPELVSALYVKAKLNRPIDMRKMEMMLLSANVKISAWDGDTLVGFLRGFTDYCFDCYVNDLAVDPAYQRQGIGKVLIQHAQELLEEDTLLFLLSAPEAIPFYRSLGFQNFNSVEDTWYVKNKKQV